MMDWSKGNGRPSTPVVVNVPSQAALLDDVAAHFERGEGFCIATINLDHVTKLRVDSDFRRAYQHHSHITADGNPIVWLSRLSGHHIGLVQGSELIGPLAELAGRHNVPVALFGATQNTLEAAGNKLEADYKGLHVQARLAPEMGFDPTGTQADAYADQLAAAGTRLCFLALGAPKQEIFAIHARKRHPHMGFVSIGAGLDFISGEQVRAPWLIRRLALEWLWRLIGNPRRLMRRYRDCFAILPRLLGRALRARADQTGDA